MSRFLIETGGFTGTGSSLAVNVGWSPKAVMLFSEHTAGAGSNRAASIKTDTMPGAEFMELGLNGSTYITSNGITLSASGFTLGTRNFINRSGWPFHWVAFGDCPCVVTGSYSGDDSSQSSVVRDFSIGRGPELLILFRTGSVVNTSFLNGESLKEAISAYGPGSGNLWRVSHGFQVKNGSGSDHNLTGDTYHYLSLYGYAGETAYAFSGTLSGGSAPINVGTVDQPRVVVVMRDDLAGFKSDTMSGQGCGIFGTQYDYSSSGVSLNVDGFSIQSGLSAAGQIKWFAVHGEGA